jgi:CRP/FNR family transcriptional regulator, cyclic AMP receptor protein
MARPHHDEEAIALRTAQPRPDRLVSGADPDATPFNALAPQRCEALPVEFSLLGVLGRMERTALEARLRTARFRRGQVVFNDGDVGDHLYLVRSGRFDVQLTTPNGTGVVVRVIQPGEFFGELALVEPNARRTGRVSALEDSETLSLRRTDFDDLRASHPSVERVLVVALAERVRVMTAFTVELMMSPEQRIWRRLMVLADAYGAERIRLSQDDLARIAGTVRQTVNRVLKAGERAGVLEMGRGELRIVDRAALARLAH